LALYHFSCARVYCFNKTELNVTISYIKATRKLTVVVRHAFFSLDLWMSRSDPYDHPKYGVQYTDTMYMECTGRAPSSNKWNFRTQFLENFRTISGHFCQFHEAQDTEKAHVYVLINVIRW